MSWGWTVTRSPYSASSPVNAIDDAVRPPYRSVHDAPSASARATIGRIGVIPIPPATKTYDPAGSNRKWFRGPTTSTTCPGRSTSCTYADPPRPAASRSTPSR